MSENDADKRPYIFGKATEGGVEVTVEGAEGETTNDISDTFEEKLEQVTEAQNQLVKDNGPTKGHE